eukprot:GFUD01108328.1.p1 GENE.GFUD01108328.1~~GFUD01108328.1.p1  ORF type:complete len:104 (-),score=20.17 GFUD01108328.1:44-355(-)
MADLDSLLVDLESSIEHRGSASASQQGKRVTDFVNTQKREEGRGGARSRQDPRSQLGAGHPASETMTTAALSNNLNELDILLQIPGGGRCFQLSVGGKLVSEL